MIMNDNIKTAIAVLTAGLVALGATISDGVTAEEAIAIALAMLAALGGGTAYSEHRKAVRAEAEVARLTGS
jgi:hypothetical protein